MLDQCAKNHSRHHADSMFGHIRRSHSRHHADPMFGHFACPAHLRQVNPPPSKISELWLSMFVACRCWCGVVGRWVVWCCGKVGVGGKRKEKAEEEEGEEEMESVAPTATPLYRSFSAWTFASRHYLIHRKWPKRRPLGGPPRRLWWWGGNAQLMEEHVRWRSPTGWRCQRDAVAACAEGSLLRFRDGARC